MPCLERSDPKLDTSIVQNATECSNEEVKRFVMIYSGDGLWIVLEGFD